MSEEVDLNLNTFIKTTSEKAGFVTIKLEHIPTGLKVLGSGQGLYRVRKRLIKKLNELIKERV